jgi:hypothetical protein
LARVKKRKSSVSIPFNNESNKTSPTPINDVISQEPEDSSIFNPIEEPLNTVKEPNQRKSPFISKLDFNSWLKNCPNFSDEEINSESNGNSGVAQKVNLHNF